MTAACRIANAYELYQGLQDVGVETKLVVYKEMGHGIDKPRLNRQLMEENWRWFSRLWPQAEPEAADLPAWRTRSSHTAFANRWLTVIVDEVELPNGQSYEYTKLEPPGVGVGVIGFNAAGEGAAGARISTRRRRGDLAAARRPGGRGRVAAGGRAARTARGDGLRARRDQRRSHEQTVRHLGTVWDNPGLSPWQSHIFAAWGLERVEGIDGGENPDEAEFVTLHWQTVSWLKEAVRSGEIRDRFVVGALAQLWLHGLID